MHAADIFSVATGSPEPIYRQLTAQVQRMVAAGQLRAGDELPSVREVAQELAVNPMTVSRAYSQLEMDGVLERRRGLGMVIAATHVRSRGVSDRSELLRPALERAAREAVELELTEAQALAAFKRVLREQSREERGDEG